METTAEGTRRTTWLIVAGLLLLVVLALVAVFVWPGTNSAGGESDGRVSVTLLQMNDVYELTPVSGGAEGGLARVAAVRGQYLERNPHTLTILAGDLLSPSALGTAMVDGERLAGRQMVDVMNAVGLDYATFGNHEFDIPEDAFRKRLAESKFLWLSSNVTGTDGQPFPGVPLNKVFSVKDEDGDEIEIGLIGLTVGSNSAPWAKYEAPIEAAKKQVAELRDRVDLLIAITHLPVGDDIALAQAVPEIDLIIGGHEHENNDLERGENFTPIVKADANARTLQVHQLVYDLEDKDFSHSVQLRRITSDDPEDPKVADQVKRWVDAAFAGFRSQGFDPERVVTETTEDLDGTEAAVRNHPTRLTDLIAQSLIRAAGQADLGVFNSGSIRIDDVIPAGGVTEYDVIRALPFSDSVVSAQVSGDLLRKVLDQGRASVGTGGYLQTANVSFTDRWLINGAPLEAGRTYTVAINDFLVRGGSSSSILNRDNVSGITEHGDFRTALIAQLEATYGKA